MRVLRGENSSVVMDETVSEQVKSGNDDSMPDPDEDARVW